MKHCSVPQGRTTHVLLDVMDDAIGQWSVNAIIKLSARCTALSHQKMDGATYLPMDFSVQTVSPVPHYCPFEQYSARNVKLVV